VTGTEVALNAIGVAAKSNVFVASNDNGRASRFSTTGNRQCHLIHRGTDAGPNYKAGCIEESARALMHRGFIPRVVVDASHGNSEKDHRKQASVIEDVVGQVVSGSTYVAGFMYESYLNAGNQPIPQDLSELLPDTSVTDGCDDIATTATVLRRAHQALATRPRK